MIRETISKLSIFGRAMEVFNYNKKMNKKKPLINFKRIRTWDDFKKTYIFSDCLKLPYKINS